MTRSELLAELQAHGFHMVTVRDTSPQDLAKGVGLLLLGLEELLGDGQFARAPQSLRETPLPREQLDSKTATPSRPISPSSSETSPASMSSFRRG